MLIQNPIPTPPSPKDKHSPAREGDTINTLKETVAKFTALVEYLGQFIETDLLDANGQALRVLAQQMGSQPVASTPLHAYSVVDATTGGTTQVTVTSGNHTDLTPGGSMWIPKIGGVAINAGTPPVLAISSSDTVVYFAIPVNALDGSGATPAGQISGDIDIEAAASLPASTNTMVYLPVDLITVVASTSVTPQDAGVTGSQYWNACGPSPIPWPM